MQKDPDEVLTPEEDHDVSAAGVARSTNADDCDRSASVIDDTASPPAVRCPRCDRAFSSAAHVKRHIRAVHDGERSHICEQCEKAFSLKGNLRRHVKTVHEGVKLAKKRACEHCGVKFPGLGKLQLHIKSVHEHQKQYACSLCDKSYWRKAHLESHVTKMHPDGANLNAGDEQRRSTSSMDRSVLCLDVCDDKVFSQPISVHSLTHSTSPSSWRDISAARFCRGHVPDDQRYDGLNSLHGNAPAPTPPLSFAYFMASTEDPALFPLSKYPKTLSSNAKIKIVIFDPKFLLDPHWALFYIASTPTQFGGSFKKVYSSHVTVVHRNTPTFNIPRSRGWKQLDLSSNKILYASSTNSLELASKVSVSGTTYPHSLMVSFLGGLRYPENGIGPRVIDGFKLGFSNGVAECPVAQCNVKCNTVRNLRLHYQGVHLKLKPYACPQCPKSFALEKNLTVHVSTVHGGERLHVCTRCNKAFSQKSSLKLHISTVHEDGRTHVCPQCNRSFAQLIALTKHISGVHDGSKNYGCGECQRRFVTKSDLQRHVAGVHRKLKPYQCTICKKTFSQKGHLSMHAKSVHNGAKVACSLCDKQFSTTSNLQKHISIVHNGEKVHKCPECGRCFATSYHLGEHVKSVHQGVKHMCSRCKSEFATKSSLTRHTKRAHKDSEAQ